MMYGIVRVLSLAVASVFVASQHVDARRLNDRWNQPTIITRSDADLFPVSIIHLNDFHARFEETIEEGKSIGGYARIVTAVKQLQRDRSATNPIYLNAGDNFQGTLWYTMGRWNVTQQFLNMLPADAITLGNHEFDHQVAGVVPFMETIKSPIVIANLDDSLEPTMRGKYQKSIVIERYGRKIWIVGVMLSSTNTIADTGNLKFLDESESVRIESAALRAKGIDIVIVLSHSGLDVDKNIARNGGPDIDVIVGGHTHSFMFSGEVRPGPEIPVDDYPAIVEQPTGKRVLIVQASAYTKYLGDLTVWFDAAGEPVRWDGQPIYLDERVHQDVEVLAALQPWKAIVDVSAKRVLGRTLVPLRNAGCNAAECNVGNFMADAYASAWVGKVDEHWSYAPIALLTVGSIRTSLSRGELTYGDLSMLAPFENTVDTVELRGDRLLEVLEYSWTKSWNADQFSGAHAMQVSGMRLVVNVTLPVGQRVQSVVVLCRKCAVPRYVPLDAAQVYNVVVGSYVANAGDGFEVVKEHGMNKRIGPIDTDVLSGYLERMSPVMIGLDNRLTVLH